MGPPSSPGCQNVAGFFRPVSPTTSCTAPLDTTIASRPPAFFLTELRNADLGKGKGEKADGKCRMADDECQMADDKCQMADDKCQMADDECQMADDEWQMTNTRWRRVSSRWQGAN